MSEQERHIPDNVREDGISVRNLKTHFEETLAAMMHVEGDTWKHQQDEYVVKGMLTNTLEGAKRWLEEKGKNDTGGTAYILHGFGGSTRWYIDADGSVRFSAKHSGSKKLEAAKMEGFQIQS